jgi:excisionase family DNA binding protein
VRAVPRPANAKEAFSLELPDLLTVGEVAGVLHCKVTKVRALAHRRALPFYRVGKAVLIDRAAVAAYLETCYRPAAARVRTVPPEMRASGPAKRAS